MLKKNGTSSLLGSAKGTYVYPQLRKYLASGYGLGSLALARSLLRAEPAVRRFDKIRIVSCLEKRHGIVTGARLQHRNLTALGFDCELVDVTATMRSPFARVRHRPGTAYVFHIAGPQTANMILPMLPHAAHAFRIGFWAWELPDPPTTWRPFTKLLSEIWTPSSFATASLSRLSDVPVKTVAHVIKPRVARRPRPAGPFTVLTMADSRSSFSRKNPLGAIEAFIGAFGRSSEARLIVKLSGKSEAALQIEREADKHQNISILNDDLSAHELENLYQSVSALLSLHRAEGFGLPMLEAMSYGIPVVATGWSGNLDFMNEYNAVLVPVDIVPVNDKFHVYLKGNWAEPNLAFASAALRRLADDEGHYETISAAAFAAVAASRFSIPLDVG